MKWWISCSDDRSVFCSWLPLLSTGIQTTSDLVVRIRSSSRSRNFNGGVVLAPLFEAEESGGQTHRTICLTRQDSSACSLRRGCSVFVSVLRVRS